MHFYYFFDQYKRRLKDLNKGRSIMKAFSKMPLKYKILFAVLCIVVAVGISVFFLHSNSAGALVILAANIGLLIAACVCSYNSPQPKSEEITRSKQRITMVIDLLKEYNIDPSDSGKIKRLIDYAKEDQLRSDIFLDFKKTFQAISVPVVAIVGYVFKEIAKYSQLDILIVVALELVAIICCTIMMANAIKPLIEDLINPEKNKYQNLIDDLNQIKLVDIYADEGITGTCMEKRDEMQRLIRDCKKGLIDRIIVKSVSRFARNTQELLTTIRVLKDIGVSIYFEEQGINTDKLNSEMIVTFPGMAAQQESESISGNMRWSYKKRMESGDFNCCTPAYGYDRLDGQLVINQEEAAIVRRIFDLYLQGMGMQAIASKLASEGIPRKYGYQKWSYLTIKYILNNERYMGDALLQKSYTTDTLPYKQKRNHGEHPQYYVENANPAIISKEIFQKVQELQVVKRPSPCKNKSSYPLSGMLRCPDCGRTFRRVFSNGTAYWVCNAASAGETNCSRRRVKEESVYEAFLSMLGKLKEFRKPLLGVLISDMEMMLSRTSDHHNRIAEIDSQVANLAAQNLVITRLHTNGILSTADYTAQASEINGKITALRSERRKKLREDEDDEQLDRLKELYEILETFDPTHQFDEDFFRQIVERVRVENNAEITFCLAGSIELAETIHEKGRCHSS